MYVKGKLWYVMLVHGNKASNEGSRYTGYEQKSVNYSQILAKYRWDAGSQYRIRSKPWLGVGSLDASVYTKYIGAKVETDRAGEKEGVKGIVSKGVIDAAAIKSDK